MNTAKTLISALAPVVGGGALAAYFTVLAIFVTTAPPENNPANREILVYGR